MDAQQQNWKDIGDRFGLIVRLNVPIDLDGRQFIASVLLPQLGAPRGMVVVTSYALIEDVAERLVEAGFGYSCLSQILSDDTTIASILRDWGRLDHA